jgi:hypothetical protein
MHALRRAAAPLESALDESHRDKSATSLSEDAEDLAAFADREKEPNIDFEVFVRNLAALRPSRKAS